MISRTLTVLLTLVALAGTCLAGDAGFSAKPSAEKAGDKVKIAFVVAAPTDVEVAVLGADGKVVRHLAAGVLGAKTPPPEPLKPGLAQGLEWDGRDDAGKPAAGGPFKVRVGAGMAAKLRGTMGGNPYVFGTPHETARLDLATDKNGLLYVYHVGCYKGDGTLTIQVHDASGKYLKTILPAPADMPFEKIEPFRAIKLEDGTWCFDNFGGGRFPQLYPGMGGPKQGGTSLIPTVTPDDRLVLFNDRSAFMIKSDGSAPGKSYQRSLWSSDWNNNWGNPPNTGGCPAPGFFGQRDE